ncbi:MAG: caspase family protein [Treponema sp.]|nr:caspase family protein [Treponema sp.]
MNIAIVIGNSDYDNLSKLDACKNDIKAINDVLKATGKYEEIFVEQNKKSSELKKSLTSIVESIKNSKISIEELVFYYTGHGCYKSDQFYFLPIDYDLKRHSTSSLSNDELDEMLKSLNPQLTVKLIDACESGQPYIKSNADAKDTFLNASKNRFNNCYFMYSSNRNQESSASNDFGFFTLSFLRAIKNCSEKEIRYKDIIDFITDDFTDNDEQKPFFVTQADYTDYFCKDLTPVKEVLKNYNLEFVNDELISTVDEKDPSAKSLVDFIKDDAEKCIPKDNAINNLIKLREASKKLTISPKLNGIYEFSVFEIKNMSDINGINNILDDVKKYKYEMFINLIYSSEEYETEVQVPKPVNPFFRGSLGSFFQEYETKTVTRTRKVLSGFEHSFNTPFSGLRFQLMPKFPNVRKRQLNFIFIFNKRDFIIYSNNEDYYEKEWNLWESYTVSNWVKNVVPFTNYEDIEKTLVNEVEQFQNDAMIQLEKKFLK